MDDEEDVLDIGSRHRHPRLTRVLVVLVLVCAIGGFFVLRGRGDHPERQGASSPAPTTVTTYPILSPPSSSSPSLPPWPRADGACGSEAFLPIVSAAPLETTTGLHLLVGDRLRTVDVDSGAVTPSAGLPSGLFASDVATTAAGRYALLEPCSQGSGGTPIGTVVRLDSGGLHQVAHGRFGQLLAGGNHPWAVIWPAKENDPILLDPLDGGRRFALPKYFDPLAGFGDLVIGTASSPENSSAAQPFEIRMLDPVTGHVRLSLGPASSVGVDSGLIVWIPAGCQRCSVHTYDPATVTESVTPGRVAAGAGLWPAVVSPDHRYLAFLRPRSTPARYETDHPGNPNEIAVLHLDTGRIDVVPDIVLWPKSSPGLAFSRDSVWLAITLDEGTRVRLLVWHLGFPEPLQSPARLDGKVAYGPSVTAGL